MNTFHLDNTEVTTTKAEYLFHSSCGCELENEYQESINTKLQKIKGFAIKTTHLNELSLDITHILYSTKLQIVVDAEYERLDHWLRRQLQSGRIKIHDLSRIMITVQIKRDDAIQQIQNLTELGVKIILVMGNDAYLKAHEIKRNVINRFIELMGLNGVSMLGIGTKLKSLIERVSGDIIHNSKIFELQGYQSLDASNLWVYYAGTSNTKHMNDYLKRRKSNLQNSYIARSINDLSELSKSHSLYLYIDGCTSDEILHRIQILTRMTLMYDQYL